MYRVGMYGGSFNPLHNGHVKCIKKALKQCDELHIIVGDLPNRDEFDISTKISWFRSVFKNYMDRIFLYDFIDSSTEKSKYTLDNWIYDAEIIKGLIGKHIDVVFCGTDYKKKNNPYLICYSDSEIVYFDREDNISSTKIRNNFIKYKDDMPKCVYNSFLNKYGYGG